VKSFCGWLASLVVLLAVAAGCSRAPMVATRPVVVRYKFPEAAASNSWHQDYMAIVRGDIETDLSFKVGGVLERIGPVEAAEYSRDWREGATIASNQVLAQLVQADFLSASNSSWAKFEQEENLYKRSVNLYSNKVISITELDGITARLKATKAELEQASQALRDTELRAPYAGKILSRLAEAGETVQPGRTVLRIGDLRRMSIELGVPDKFIGQIRTNDTKAITISALEGNFRSYQGNVSEVGVAAREGSRLFKVVFKVENPREELKSGMTATVHFDPPEPLRPPLERGVLVPLSALIARSSRTATVNEDTPLAVFVIKPETGTTNPSLGDGEIRGTASERVVQFTYDILGSSVVVTNGLNTNDAVVVAGAGSLYEGAPVVAKPQRADGDY
jgi:membrane fusion protein (multidrug efflux system)